MVIENVNRGPECLAIFGTGIGVAAMVVILRLWIRVRILRKVGADDWLMAASLILTFGALGCLATSAHYGLGRHTVFLSPQQATMTMKFLWVAFCITPSAEATAKISISVMLIRVTTSAKWKWFFYSLILGMTLVTIATLLCVVLSCRPIGLLWNSSMDGHCDVGERTVIVYIQAITAALYDLILASSPIVLFWNVQINLRAKIILCGLLALGLFTGIAGIVRTKYSDDTGVSVDDTYVIMDMLIWKIVELPLSIIVGCLPTLQPLFDKARRQMKGVKAAQDDTLALHRHQDGNSLRKATSPNYTINETSDDSGSTYGNIWKIEDSV